MAAGTSFELDRLQLIAALYMRVLCSRRSSILWRAFYVALLVGLDRLVGALWCRLHAWRRLTLRARCGSAASLGIDRASVSLRLGDVSAGIIAGLWVRWLRLRKYGCRRAQDENGGKTDDFTGHAPPPTDSNVKRSLGDDAYPSRVQIAMGHHAKAISDTRWFPYCCSPVRPGRRAAAQ